jgi:general secretion pathway protein D
MRSVQRSTLAIAVLLFFCCSPAVAQSANSLLKKGWQAEQRQDYETAYDFYKQAYNKKPTDLKFRVAFERTRFLAAASKIKRGQKLREQGKYQEALQLFAAAYEIDPSNDLAQQEYKRTQDLIKQQTPEVKPAPQQEDQLRQMLDKAQGPVRLGDLSNTPLQALQMPNADVKQAYETIGKLAGINILFDPDFTSRKIPVSLKDVTLQEALDIVALESRTFWRPVTPNTIFVAADNTGKRRELEQSVIKTFYLGNVATPTDIQDVVNAIRTVLEVQRIQAIPSQNAIVVRGTPDQLALAEKMIDDIDKSKPEVVVDVVVAQIRRDKVRQLGLLPPQTGSVALQGSQTNTNTTTTTGTNVPNNNNGLNFNSLQHLNSGSYAVSIPALQAEAIMSDSDTKILENPQIRAADGQKAELKVGDRIPIATGSFGTPLGIGTAVGSLGVNTQFQYQDVGVTIAITPHVHPDNEISLKATLTVSNQTGTVSIGGISQPIISQRNVDHEIRLKDGEPNLVAGILEDEIQLSTNGIPYLSKIPLIKYLFGQEDKERHTNEVIFLLIPHIVRGQVLSPLNQRAFDVGTGTSIGLRVVGNAPPKTDSGVRQPAANPNASAPASQPQSQPQAQTQPQSQPAQQQVRRNRQQATPEPAPTAAPAAAPAPDSSGSPEGAASAVNPPAAPVAESPKPAADSAAPGSESLGLHLDPPFVISAVGGNVNVNVKLAGGQDVSMVSLQLTYDPRFLQFTQATAGDFLGRDGQAVPVVNRNDPATGTLTVSAARPPGLAGISGSGTVFNLAFTAKAKGSTGIAVAVPSVRNSQNRQMQAQSAPAIVNVN